MDLELLPGSGSETQKIPSWIRIWNKSFRIHNTEKNRTVQKAVLRIKIKIRIGSKVLLNWIRILHFFLFKV